MNHKDEPHKIKLDRAISSIFARPDRVSVDRREKPGEVSCVFITQVNKRTGTSSDTLAVLVFICIFNRAYGSSLRGDARMIGDLITRLFEGFN